jgi:hypothetical protein
MDCSWCRFLSGAFLCFLALANTLSSALELFVFFLVVANVDNGQTGGVRDINSLLPACE